MANTDLCNEALSHLGVSVEISDLDADKSKEAKACRRFYDTTLDEVLRDFPWSFANVIEPLALVEDFSEVESDWLYSYRYPANAVAIRNIFLDGVGRMQGRHQRGQTRYVIGRDDTGLLLFTDLADATVEYTRRETDTSRFSPDFRAAFTHLLAHKIGPRVAGDRVQLVAAQYPLYDAAMVKARANAMNEQRPDSAPFDELLRARGTDIDDRRWSLRSPLES
jgi:hypothetical protein